MTAWSLTDMVSERKIGVAAIVPYNVMAENPLFMEENTEAEIEMEVMWL